MDWFLYYNDLRHERVKDSRIYGIGAYLSGKRFSTIPGVLVTKVTIIFYLKSEK